MPFALLRPMRILCLLLIVLSFNSFASDEVTKLKLEVQTKDGTTKVNAYHYLNAWGRKEVRLEATTIPLIGKMNPTLGYGRDTDDDGKVDVWFMIDSDKGMVKYLAENQDEWGHTYIKEKLFKQYKSTVFAHASAAYGAVFGTVLMSISHGWESQRIYWIEWMDLEEFNLRLHRAKDEGMINLDQYSEGINTLINGYRITYEKLEHATNEEYWTLGAVDIALWACGGVVVKWLGKGLAFITGPITRSATVIEAKAAVGNMLSKTLAYTKSQISRLRGIQGVTIKVLATQAFKKQLQSHMTGLMAKNALLRKVYFRLAKSEIALIRTKREWKYIAFMAGIQLTSESFAHASEVVHANPAITAQNVLMNPEIMKNVGFMTRDALMMTAASHGIKTKSTRYVTCGFIALGHSAVTNLWLNEEENPDYARVALDTGWEATIGNAQIQIDLHALKYFEEVAVRKFNPRLQLLGWAVILVEQAVGFVGYSKATEALAEHQAGVQLVPVVVENN